MNQEQLRIASDCLRAIKDEDGMQRHIPSGICQAMSDYMESIIMDEDDSDTIYHGVKVMMKDWPEGSGCEVYPVPDPDVPGVGAAMRIYIRAQDCWSGTYGELRLNLLGWLIAKVEDQFN